MLSGGLQGQFTGIRFANSLRFAAGVSVSGSQAVSAVRLCHKTRIRSLPERKAGSQKPAARPAINVCESRSDMAIRQAAEVRLEVLRQFRLASVPD